MLVRTTAFHLLFLLLAWTGRAATYTITDLGTLGGTSSKALAINASGQVVGSATLAGNVVSHAFLYSGGNLQDLGTFGGLYSQANGITDSGLIVGSASFSSGSSGFVYALGLMISSGTLGGTSGETNAINSAGKSAGDSTTTNNAATRAYTYDGSSLTPIATLGGTNNHAYAINDTGQVAGDSQIAGNTSTHAFRYTPGSNPLDLGTLGSTGLLGSSASGINNGGTVVGVAYIANGQNYHAFIYRNNAMSDLSTLGGLNSQAKAITDSEIVVGSSETSPNSAFTHAFLWSGGQMQDLNNLVDANTGWELQVAAAINDKGQIAGSGTINGQTHAFLLTPISANNNNPNADRPRIYINGGNRVVTGKSWVHVEGSVGGPVIAVKYHVGKGAYRSANGGTNGWKFKARLKVGRNVIQVISVAADGTTSYPAKLVAIRR